MNTKQNLQATFAAALLVTCTSALAEAKLPKPAAAQPLTMTVSDISACARKNLVDRAALRDLAVTATDREGKSHSLKMKLYWKPAKKTAEPRMTLRLVEPLAIRGSSYLLVQNGAQEEVYFYLPGADRSLKITGQNMTEPLWNTDFSYGEIKQVLGLLAIGSAQRRPDGSVGGRSTYVLETSMSAEATGYQKILSYVDQATCVVLKSEFFAKADKPRKVLEADLSTLMSADKYNLVLGYTMKDLAQGSHTEIALTDFTLEERLPDRLFDPKRFFEPFE